MKSGLLASISMAACLCAQAGAQNGATVEGRVIDSVTGVGIPGVAVEIHGGPGYQTTTDESGEFRVTGVKYGNYVLTVKKEGYDRIGGHLLRPPARFR